MAIDSAEKRRSAANVPWSPAGVGVTPNASTDAEWRAQVAWTYSGITAGVGAPGTAVSLVFSGGVFG